jgi:hypothetical protein
MLKRAQQRSSLTDRYKACCGFKMKYLSAWTSQKCSRPGVKVKEDYEDEVAVDYFKALCRNLRGETEKTPDNSVQANGRPVEDQEPPLTEQKRISASTATCKNIATYSFLRCTAGQNESIQDRNLVTHKVEFASPKHLAQIQST